MVDEIALREVDRWIDKNRSNIDSRTLRMLQEITLEIGIDDSTNPAVFDIMEQILAAGDLDAVFAAANAGTTAGKDYTDKPFYLRQDDVQWKISAIGLEQEGFPVYTLSKVTDMGTGERFVMNCGGITWCTVVYTLGKLGAFEQFGEEGIPLILKEKPVRNGRTVLIPNKYVIPSATPPKSKTVKGEKVSD